jgi:hypothetical protein
MQIKNNAGFVFIWPEGSKLVEVFHALVSFPDQPLEVVDMGSLSRSESSLRLLANSTREYTRL